MKIRKVLVVCLSALLFATVGCNAPSGEKTENSGASSAPASLSSASQSLTSTAASSEQSVSSELASSKQASSEKTSSAPKVSSKKEQSNSEWVAYDTNKDNYKLHIRKKDGTEDKVIVNDVVLAPCVAGEWVYFFPTWIQLRR